MLSGSLSKKVAFIAYNSVWIFGSGSRKIISFKVKFKKVSLKEQKVNKIVCSKNFANLISQKFSIYLSFYLKN